MRSSLIFSIALLCIGCGAPIGRPNNLPTDPGDDAAITDSDDGGAPDLAVKHDLSPHLDNGLAQGDLAATDDGGLIVPTCPMGITIKPTDATLYVDATHQFSLSYQVLCGGFDVGPASTLTLDNGALGAFTGAQFTSASGAAGVTTVRVDYMGSKASTSLTLKLTTVVVAMGTDPNAPNKFGGANNPNLAPTWVYPDDGILIPPNLSVLEFQFLPVGNTLFEFGFSGGGVNLKVYTQCNVVGNGCAFTMDEPTWALLSTVARSNAISITLRGTSGANVGAAAARTLNFADEDVTGGLYYWSASTGGIVRYDFGLRNQAGEDFYSPGLAGSTCVGCHAMSRDGSRIAVGLGIPGPAQMRILDVATKKDLFDVGGVFGGGSNYQTLTSDGQKIVTTEGGGLTVRNANTGALIGGIAQVANANMPDISADGTEVVFSRGMPTCMFGICDTLSSLTAGIFMTNFTGMGFGGVKTLVPIANGQTNYYPAFTPDGKFVIFNRAAGDSYDAPDARLMAISVAGGNPIDLAGLNTTLGNTWPKWAPFTHHFNGSEIFWLTWSTTRAFGLRGGTNYQLWMAAIDAGQLAHGGDGSFPAFRLPFQDAATGNHISQWVTTVVRTPCGIKNFVNCPGGEVCVNGSCQPGP